MRPAGGRGGGARTLAARGRPLGDLLSGCSTPPGCAGAGRGRGSYLDSHTPGWRFPVGLAAQPERAKGGEAPSPRLIPEPTRAPAAQGAPFPGPLSLLEGSGRRHRLGHGEARLPRARDPGRRPSLAAPAAATLIPVPSVWCLSRVGASAAMPKRLGKSCAAETYPVAVVSSVLWARRGPPLVLPSLASSVPWRSHCRTPKPRRSVAAPFGGAP